MHVDYSGLHHLFCSRIELYSEQIIIFRLRRVYDPFQGRQFVFRSGGDNNHKLECGLKSAGYPYVSYSSIQRCITICCTVYCQVWKLFEYWFGKLVFEA